MNKGLKQRHAELASTAASDTVLDPLRLNKAVPYYPKWEWNTNADLLVLVFKQAEV